MATAELLSSSVDEDVLSSACSLPVTERWRRLRDAGGRFLGNSVDARTPVSSASLVSE